LYMQIQPPGIFLRLNGCGLVVANPPYGLEEQLAEKRQKLDELQQLLTRREEELSAALTRYEEFPGHDFLKSFRMLSQHMPPFCSSEFQVRRRNRCQIAFVKTDSGIGTAHAHGSDGGGHPA
jgi:predicted  nucleic acid-binding Zn-ribbon protein